MNYMIKCPKFGILELRTQECVDSKDIQRKKKKDSP